MAPQSSVSELRVPVCLSEKPEVTGLSLKNGFGDFVGAHLQLDFDLSVFLDTCTICTVVLHTLCLLLAPRTGCGRKGASDLAFKLVGPWG